MKKTITFLLLGFGVWGANAQLNCANAVAVTNGTYNVSYTAGSEIPPMSCVGQVFDGDVRTSWFKYTPTVNHNLTVSSYIPGNPTYDTKVNVYLGPCAALSCIGGNDDGGPDATSVFTFPALVGNTYYIVFDDMYDDSNFSFTVTEGVFTPPAFNEAPIALTGEYQMAVVDMNGDFLDDIVGVNNGSVNIMLQEEDGGFTAVTRTAPNTPNMPNWSMAAGDFDKNGYNDLLYGNGSGAAIILASDDGASFDDIIQSDAGFYLFSQRTNFVDINNDGNLDAFVCHDVQPNVYFTNDGEGGAVFHQGGLGDHPNGGNYGSIWIDYDNDGDPDLFIAKCRGGGSTAGINELHRNDGNGVFTQIAGMNYPENNMSDIIQTWSSAWADYDNDGDMDGLIGASSTSNGSHKLMVNNGNGTFTDGTAGTGYDTFTGLNIEHIAHDFNNDGWVDVYGGGGQIMYNNGDMTFTPIAVNAPHGPVGDLNNDGFLDIYSREFGGSGTAYYGNPNENNWVKVSLKGIESNGNGIGARVEVFAAGDGWSKQIRDIRSGDGFEFMSSLNAHFGLGETDAIEKIVIKWPSGTVDTINNPSINSTLHVVEGETVLAVNEVANNMFTIYPNPVKDVISISGNNNINKITVYDLNGRLVKTLDVTDGKASVQSLSKGVYLVTLTEISGKQYSSKIIKE